METLIDIVKVLIAFCIFSYLEGFIKAWIDDVKTKTGTKWAVMQPGGMYWRKSIKFEDGMSTIDPRCWTERHELAKKFDSPTEAKKYLDFNRLQAVVWAVPATS